MENIKDYFFDTKFNEETRSILNKFINEFDELFGKYIPKDKVIDKINKNLQFDIEFYDKEDMEKVDDKKSLLGFYIEEEKRIVLLKDLDEEKKGSVSFHELIHCIWPGFKVFDVDRNGKSIEKMAHGLTEAFTQFLTKIRDKHFFGKTITGTSYPVLTEQMENLVECVGKDKFFNMAFNEQNKLNDVLKETFPKANENYIDDQDLLSAFDTIWREEKKLVQTPETQLLKAIFGETEEYENEELNASVNIIITMLCDNIYSSEITSIDDFNELYKRIEKYNKQLGVFQYYTFEPLFRNLKEKEINREIDVTEADEEYFTYSSVEEVLNLSKKEILDKIKRYEIEDIIESSNFKKAYKMRIVNKLYDDCLIDDLEERYNLLKNGLASLILYKGYNFDDISVEQIKLYEDDESEVFRECNCEKAYNLYQGIGKDKKYIGTYYDNSSNTDEVKWVQLHIVNESKYRKSDDDIILVDDNDNTLIYSKDDGYRFINQYGDIYENDGNVEYYSSRNENIVRKMNKTVEHIKSINSMAEIANYMPTKILEYNKGRLIELDNLSGKKILPQNIENVTLDVSLEEIENIMREFNQEKSNQELFERGVKDER